MALTQPLSQLPDHYMSQDISGLQLPNTVCVPRGVCGNSSSTYKIEKTNGVFYTSSNRAFQILLLQWIPNCCLIFPQCSCIYFRGATQEQWGLQPRLVCPGWRPCGKIPWKLHHPGILGFTSKIVATWNIGACFSGLTPQSSLSWELSGKLFSLWCQLTRKWHCPTSWVRWGRAQNGNWVSHHASKDFPATVGDFYCN